MLKDDFNTRCREHLWLLFWAIAILDDADRHEEERRRKSQCARQRADEDRRKRQRKKQRLDPR